MVFVDLVLSNKLSNKLTVILYVNLWDTVNSIKGLRPGFSHHLRRSLLMRRTYSRLRSYGKRRGPSRRSFKRSFKRSTSAKKRRGPKVDRVITKIFKFWCNTTDTLDDGKGLIQNLKNGGVGSNIVFVAQRIPGVDKFAQVYSEFRMDKITLKFIPTTIDYQVDDTDTGTSASQIAKATPMYYIGRFYGDERQGEITYTNEQAAILEGAKYAKMTEPMTFSFVPNTLNVATQSTRATNGLGNPNLPVMHRERKKWQSFQPYDTAGWEEPNFYGVKTLVANTTSDTGEFAVRVLATVKMSFRGFNSATLSNQEGTAATVYWNVN